MSVGAYTLVKSRSAAAAWAASGWRRAATAASKGRPRSSCSTPRWSAAPASARFTREGTILARLTHPHIARLIDAGVSATGQPYLVLEHVDGQHIDQHCD